ncbi:Subtilase family protein [Thermoactinomyces sp. DSM 45891]|uniref:S8 family peptidase n=1 Tax=Thermoactinomyces sp. DSM 45891 TaxID=1761907 RepID=UPI00091447EA|nr:S8 family peptidase [Thermoactinomyces sp. DSM 45891]SFX45313.1 Subtilase family protein [Thermoactinomyces sp. DSM 45891]
MESHQGGQRFTFLYQNESRVERFLELGCQMEYVGCYTPMITATVSSWKQMREIEKDSELVHVESESSLQLLPYELKKVYTKKRPVKTRQKGEVLPWNIRRVLRGKSRTFTGKGIKVGIIDTGIDFSHPDLSQNVHGGVNIIEPGKPPHDLNGHGTHVSGVIGAAVNQLGIIGVAPDVSLYAIKVLNKKGVGSLSDLVRGIEWGISNNMDILNISISGGKVSPVALEKAIQVATRRGIFVVAAAGNAGQLSGKGDTVEVPARVSNAIAVAALSKSNKRASFSATGSTVDVAAPGVKVVSTYPGMKYAALSGTSMAAAHVSGVLALFKQKHPKASHATILKKLFASTKVLSSSGRNSLTGRGLVQF